MLHDILIPCRIGNYYLYSKRVLSFEITPMMVQGILIEYIGRSIKIKNKQSISLKDFSVQAQASALKKIASSIGAYDEIVTTLSSSAVVYKELQLPFIGRDALQMVVPYEVEPLLPFSLDDAVIDFIVTTQDTVKKQSTLLVAAVRKEDVIAQKSLFEKAELPLHTVTIDMFVLYEIYKVAIWSAPVGLQQTDVTKKSSMFDLKSSSVISLWQSLHTKLFKKQTKELPEEPTIQSSLASALNFGPKRAELLVDIGFDVIRVLYMQDGILHASRMIPMGISDLAQKINQQTQLPYYDVVQAIVTVHATQDFQDNLRLELKKLFEEVTRTLLFFEKQEGQVYVKPEKIWFCGFATTTQSFQEASQEFFGQSAHVVDVASILQRLNISQKIEDHSLSVMGLAIGLFVHYEPYVNFLKSVAQKSDNSLFNKQITVMVCMTLLCIGATFWRSSSLLQQKESIYNASKKEFMQAVAQRMGLDVKNEKNVKDVVAKAEAMLHREKALWFAFSAQQERSVLEYLQDLSVNIDREASGLQLSQMHLDFEKVTMTGTVKDFNARDVFEEELMSLQLLQLVDKPRELSFTVQLKPKDDLKGNA